MESISPQSLLEFVYRDSDVVQYLQQTDLALGQSTNVALTRQQAIPTIYRVSHRGREHESISEHGTIGEHGGECWWLPATDRNPRCGRRLSTRQGSFAGAMYSSTRYEYVDVDVDVVFPHASEAPRTARSR